MTHTFEITPEMFTRVNNDVNGNPRYVIHFCNLVTDVEHTPMCGISEKYVIACKRANKIGGRKYHNKSYGGGVVFQSYNLQSTCNDILAMLAKVN
jgi:hypothetical protein